MDTTGHSNDENEEWLKELLQYNREAHGCVVFKAMLVLQVMRNKIGSQHVGPMSGQNRPPCIYPCCCRWGMSTNAQICWGYTFCSSNSSQTLPIPGVASPAKRRRRCNWRDTLDRAVLQLPRTCPCFERIEVDNHLDYDLPRGHRLAGQILCHVYAAVDKILERHAPCIFKAGYTHCPIYRFYNDVFGYIHEKDRWEKMTVVYVSHEVISPSFVEAAIIQRHKGSLYQLY